MDGVSDGLREICLSAAGGARSAASLGRPKSRIAVARSGSSYPRRRGHFLKTAWGYYAERVVKLPPEPTVGSRMNVKLACFTMSFFNAFLGIGTERTYVIELVADAAWRIYRLWSTVALGMVLVTPGKTTSLAFAVTNPGIRMGACP